MATELTNDEIEELVGLNEVDKSFLKARDNGLLLTDNQVSTLKRYNIDPAKCNSMSELLYMIGEVETDEDDDLSYLADQLSEINYYNNTRK